MPDIQTEEFEKQKPKGEKQQVTRWHDRISTSIRYRDRVADDARWDTFLKEYKGQYDVELGNIIVPPINEVFAYVQTAISGLLFKDPYITVNPKKTGTLRGAAIMEVALNYYFRELKIKQELELSTMDALLIGHGWNKTGTAVQTSGKGEQLKLEAETLYSMRVSWKDMVFNIGARRPPYDCQWMAQRIIRPLEDVKKSYDNTKDLRGTFHPFVNKDDQEKTLYKDDILFSVLWEIWDTRDRKVHLVADGHDKYLKSIDWPEYLDEFPFHMLWFNAIPDEPYPMSDIAPWEPQILEKIKLFTQILNHAKRWNRQIFIKRGALDNDEKDKYEKGIDGSFIEFNSQDIMRDLRFADYGSFPMDFPILLDRLDQIKTNVNGQPEFSRGASPRAATRTLGELELVSSGAKSRVDAKIDRIESHIEAISRHLLAHMQANFDLEQIVKITGETPESVIKALIPFFDPVNREIRFSKEDIQGEYDVDVKAGSTLPMNKETRLAVLNNVLKNIGPAAQMAMTSPFMKQIITEMLQDYDVKGLEVAFEQEISGAQQKMQAAAQSQKYEDAKIAMEAEKRKSQANKIDAEASRIQQEDSQSAVAFQELLRSQIS